ncbi:M61 family metallopeptidase [Acetobacter senegalensis]|uniref:M61 family metallopeptidase n=1 Tax=Acetobacter senegalensis TaxID=446692 RepID=UPI0038D15A04
MSLRTHFLSSAMRVCAGMLVMAAVAPHGLSKAYAADASAQSQPEPLPLPPSVPTPQDVPYGGTISLKVNATDLPRHILSMQETIPLPANVVEKGGNFTLLYPMWLPGNHSPTGTIDQLGGLKIQAGGKQIPWVRDTVTVSAFHVQVPKGTHQLEVSYQLLTPVSPKEGRVVMTDVMVNVQWSAVSLYPAGYFTRQIQFKPQVVFPAGWSYGTALRADGAQSGNTVTFKPVSFNVLEDSPIFSGKYFRKFDLTQDDKVPVTLNVMADRPEDLAATDEQIKAHRELVHQANLLFGSHHYDHYDFLLALTDKLGGIGLEHHQSSENSGPRGYFTHWDKTFAARDLLAHEFTHSWNGKYRRPADLWAANFNTPQRGSGLWVYEGQTQYWGYVLAARAGLMTAPQVEDALAEVAAVYDGRQGRTWRPLIDTTNDPIISQRAPQSWRSWSRSEDYYSEGQLIWLDVDTLIRKLSDNKKSLNDFASTFFGTHNGSFVTSTYQFDDVVQALNAVQPYDWATFLHQRVYDIRDHAPLDGFTRTGTRLVFTEKPSDYITSYSTLRHVTDFLFSLGFSVGKKGVLAEVLWGSPAWQAGVTRDQELVAVNGQAYDANDLKDVITAAKSKDGAPISLLLRDGDSFHTVSITYHGGLRYPHLDGKMDGLAAILAPVGGQPSAADHKE